MKRGSHLLKTPRVSLSEFTADHFPDMQRLDGDLRVLASINGRTPMSRDEVQRRKT